MHYLGDHVKSPLFYTPGICPHSLAAPWKGNFRLSKSQIRDKDFTFKRKIMNVHLAPASSAEKRGVGFVTYSSRTSLSK